MRYAGGVVLPADVFHAGPAQAADHGAAGEQVFARAAQHGLGLAGEQRLVDFNLPAQYDAVRADLRPGGELDDVVGHQLLHRYFGTAALAYNSRRRRVEQ